MVSQTQVTPVITTSTTKVAPQVRPITAKVREESIMETTTDQETVTWTQVIMAMLIMATLGLMIAFLIVMIKAI
jgi:hypothetical protein